MKILEVENLNVWDSMTKKSIIHNSSFSLNKGECLAIVGESGSGKSITCRSVIRLNKGNIYQSGDIFFKGVNLSTLSEKEMRKKRGKQIGMIMQNGMEAFDPSCKVGVQFREILHMHTDWNKKKVEEKMVNAMESVLLKNPGEHVINKYPHQLSGGMLQRIMIALAIALEPEIIIADEPTTALDTIAQFEVIEQFCRMREKLNASILFISHDLGVVSKVADHVLVMKDGEIIERGNVQIILSNPQHKYTRYLVSTRKALGTHFKEIMNGGALIAKSK